MSARSFSLLAAATLVTGAAFAQAPGPDQGFPGGSPAPTPGMPANSTVVTPGPAGGVVVGPGAPSTTTIISSEPFVDPNASLPSSSRPKLGDARDGFDFRQGDSGEVVVGNEGGEAILGREGCAAPSFHRFIWFGAATRLGSE